ncbi:hypothetical protein ADEAN_000630600 [Angomonas deanei]|uniref:Uncharacterized protein n=1 Tax=Angomonas deanei TaxID=59799 RepID=A0A7G2CJN0_9TRYP|nr:hypothetical protein ADEAN_000630600 [Angomonas deanei]
MSKDSQSISALLGGSAGYGTAFDLEVWKSQQQARFRSQLTQAKEKLEKAIREEYAKKNSRDLAEMEKAKRELEETARQLQSAADVLKQRSIQFEQREEAFEARRVKVAEQHERHLVKVEERAQRMVDENQLLVADLKAQLREKDTMLLQKDEKLRVAESDYEMLRRKAAKLISESERGADGQKLRDIQCKLAAAEETNLELQKQLRMHLDDVERLQRKNTHLEKEMLNYRTQSEEWGRKYTALLEEWRAKESEYLEREREVVEEKRRELLRSSRSADLARQLQIPHSALPVSDNGDLAQMLRDLQSEVVAGMREVKSSHGAPTRQLVYAERPVQIKAAPVPRERPPSPPPPEEPSVEVEEQPRETPPPQAVEMSATSSYPPVEESWLEGNEWGAPAGLPPLAPPHENSPLRPQDTEERGETLGPADFARARDGASDSGSRSTREEMINFVQQLKMNRQKLLDTGVYTESHAVVREDGRKDKGL